MYGNYLVEVYICWVILLVSFIIIVSFIFELEVEVFGLVILVLELCWRSVFGNRL